MADDLEEIVLKEFIIRQKERVKYLKDKWVTILFALIVGSIVGLVATLFVKPKYDGVLSFVLSTDSKGGSFSSLASQFGVDLGGSSGNDVFTGDNILTLFKSEKMINEVLFKKPPTQNDILANIIAKEWKWNDDWKKHDRTNGAFPFPDSKDRLTPVQDSLLRELHIKITDECLSVSRKDKKQSVYSITTTSTNAVFSCYLTKYLMDETANFYIDTKTSISKRNLAMLQREADSLRYLLGRSITATGASADRTFNLNTALQVERASTQKNQANATVVATAYSEVVKNLEIAKITLQKETPVYQIIDVPHLPLKKVTASKLTYMAIGAAAAFVLSVALLLLLMQKKVLKIQSVKTLHHRQEVAFD